MPIVLGISKAADRAPVLKYGLLQFGRTKNGLCFFLGHMHITISSFKVSPKPVVM